MDDNRLDEDMAGLFDWLSHLGTSGGSSVVDVLKLPPLISHTPSANPFSYTTPSHATGWAGTLSDIFKGTSDLLVSYYQGVGAVNLAKANSGAARYGDAGSQASGAFQQSVANITAYMPYILGAGALGAVALMIHHQDGGRRRR